MDQQHNQFFINAVNGALAEAAALGDGQVAAIGGPQPAIVGDQHGGARAPGQQLIINDGQPNMDNDQNAGINGDGQQQQQHHQQPNADQIDQNGIDGNQQQHQQQQPPQLPPLDIFMDINDAAPLQGEWVDEVGQEPELDAPSVWYDYEFIRPLIRRTTMWKQLLGLFQPNIAGVRLWAPDDFRALRLHCDVWMLRHQRAYCQPPTNDVPLQQLLLRPLREMFEEDGQFIDFVLPRVPEIRYISMNTKRPYQYDPVTHQWTEPAEMQANPGAMRFDPFEANRQHLEQYFDQLHAPPVFHPAVGSLYMQRSGSHRPESFRVTVPNFGPPLRIPLPDGSNNDDLQPWRLEQLRAAVRQLVPPAPIVQHQQHPPQAPPAPPMVLPPPMLPAQQPVPNANQLQQQQQPPPRLPAVQPVINLFAQYPAQQPQLPQQPYQVQQPQVQQRARFAQQPTYFQLPLQPRGRTASETSNNSVQSARIDQLERQNQDILAKLDRFLANQLSSTPATMAIGPASVLQQRPASQPAAPPAATFASSSTPIARTESSLGDMLLRGKTVDLKLKPYDGTSSATSLVEWFKLFETKLQLMYGTSNNQLRLRVLASYLDGQAATWFVSYLDASPVEEITWATFKDAMIKRFEITDVGYLYKKFQQAKPLPGEDLRTYGARLETLLLQAQPDSLPKHREIPLIQAFQANLSPGIKDRVATYVDLQESVSFDQIVKWAAKLQLTSDPKDDSASKPVATAAMAATTEYSIVPFNQHQQYPSTQSQYGYDQPTAQANYVQQPTSVPPAPPTAVYHQQQQQRSKPDRPTANQVSYSPITGYKYDSLQQPAVPVDAQSKQCLECWQWGHIQAHCPRRSACVTCGRNPGHGLRLRCPLLYTQDVNKIRAASDQEWIRLQQSAPTSSINQQQQQQTALPPMQQRLALPAPAGTNMHVGQVQFGNQFPATVYKALFEPPTSIKKVGSSPPASKKVGLITNEGYDSGYDEPQGYEAYTSSTTSYDPCRNPDDLCGKVVGSQSRINHGVRCGKVVTNQAPGKPSAVRPGFVNNTVPRPASSSKPSKKQRSKKRRPKSAKILQAAVTPEPSTRVERLIEEFMRALERFVASETGSNVDADESSMSTSDDESQH